MAAMLRFIVLGVPGPHKLVARQDMVPAMFPKKTTDTDVPVFDPFMAPAPVITQLYPVAPVTAGTE